MISYKDKTFCASENHKPECDRQITQKELDHAKFGELPIAWGYFCPDIDAKECSLCHGEITSKICRCELQNDEDYIRNQECGDRT